MALVIAMLAFELKKLVPGGFLVSQIHAPLNVDERAGISTTFDVISEFERPALGTFFVVGPDLKACGLPLHASFAVLERCHSDFRLAVRCHQWISPPVALDRQRGRLFRRDTKRVGTIAETRNADARMNAICGGHTLFPAP